jgi:hypothetical protein
LLVLSRIFNDRCYSGHLKKHISIDDNSAILYTELTVHEKHEIVLINCSNANDKHYFYILRKQYYPP